MTDTSTNTYFITADIGPAFLSELRAAELDHLPLSITDKGVLMPHNINQSDISSLQTLVNNHDATDIDPEEYKQKRAKAYPKIGDQLDELMKWIDASSDPDIPQALKNIATECMNVKIQYSKPST